MGGKVLKLKWAPWPDASEDLVGRDENGRILAQTLRRDGTFSVHLAPCWKMAKRFECLKEAKQWAEQELQRESKG